MIRKGKEVPRLPMGVTFTVMGDPGRRAAVGHAGRFRIFFAALGIFLVFGCALALSKLLSESQSYAHTNTPTEHDTHISDTVVLVTATARVEKGVKIEGTQLREIRWPRDQVPQGAVRTFDEVANMYALNPLDENQPILRTSVSAVRPTSGIQDLLPSGGRAVTIPVNATTGIEGWATPGAHVDLLLTYQDKYEGINKTRVIVENAVVLSYGGSSKISEDTEESTNSMDLTTVTLGVPFSDSLKITTALDLGRISLALRNAKDVGSQGNGVFSADEWDKKAIPVAPQRPMVASKGFARVTGHDGRDKQFVLSDDNRWKSSQSEEFF